ncbi:MAG: DegT/DnrJ/EryC1/StrS family aminotransferase [Euryarchaeota archaeon]|nr:DegT/DnrJ/EryC1/StrS family aminotransferase [Euryarchaeota archaeon]
MIPIAKPMIGAEEVNAVAEAMESGGLAQGPRIQLFEERFADYIGVSHAVATSSGTAGLHVALLAHGIGAGDEVVTTPFSFIATANTVLFTGARPVFADIGEDYNIYPEGILHAITPKTKAVLPVHLYGCPAGMKAIREIAEDHNLTIIEDACQAHGATYDGKKVGSFGTGVFSFYPTKNMTTGEGGMITTDDPEIAKQARMLRDHGSSKRYVHDMLGYNLRMTDMGAAIGIVQLTKLNDFNSRRRVNAAHLTGELKHVPGITTPEDVLGHVFHQYTVRVSGGDGIMSRGRSVGMGGVGDIGGSGVGNGMRDSLVAYLGERGIGTGIYYPIPIHRQPFYRKLGFQDGLLVSERFADEVLSLPVHPAVSGDDLDYIVETIKEYFENHVEVKS